MLPSGNLVWERFPYQQVQNHIQLEVLASPPTELLKSKHFYKRTKNILDRLVGYQLAIVFDTNISCRKCLQEGNDCDVWLGREGNCV